MLDFIRFLCCINLTIIRKTIALTIKKRLTGLSAEIAFNGMLGLFPGIIAVLTAISLFENYIENTLGDLAIHFEGIVPLQVWNLLLDFTEEVKVSQGTSWFSLSFIITIWVISGAIGSAMNALNKIHQVPAKHKRPFWHNKIISILLSIGTITLLVTASFLLLIGDFLLNFALQQNWGQLLLVTWKIFSIILVICICVACILILHQIKHKDTKIKRFNKSYETITGFMIIIGTFLIQVVYFFFVIVEKIIAESNVEVKISHLLVNIWRFLSLPIALAVIAIAFAFIYHFGTTARSKYTPLMPGAILAAISWAIVSLLFRLYVAHYGSYNKVYGALGTVIVLMLWLFLSSLVMLLGDLLNVIVGKEMYKKRVIPQGENVSNK